MATDVKALTTQEEADSQEIMRLVAKGERITDAELRRRVTERAARVRQQILETHGAVEWAVAMIRDARDQ